MTDYYIDMEEPYTPPDKYNPEPSFDQLMAFHELNDFIFTDGPARELMIRDRIREDLQRGKCGLEVGLLYDIMEYINEQLCYK